MHSTDFDQDHNFEEDDGHRFNDQDLKSPDANVRRLAIMTISKEKKNRFEDVLLNLLGKEVDIANRRHIVRALGNMGTVTSASVLLHILANESGLILGEAAEALGKLGVKEAIPKLNDLRQCGSGFVENKVEWALKALSRSSP